MDELNAASPEVKALLAEVQKTTEGFKGTLIEAQATTQGMNTLAGGIDSAAVSLKGTAVELQTVLNSIERLLEEDENAPPTKPFDPQDYEKASDSLRQTVLELQSLLTSIEAVNSPPIVDQVESKIGTLSTQTAQEGRGLIDYAFKRILQLIVAAFVLLLILVVLNKMIPKGLKQNSGA